MIIIITMITIIIMIIIITWIISIIFHRHKFSLFSKPSDHVLPLWCIVMCTA